MRPQRGDVLLVLDAEPLLLVDDHQPEILVADGRLQQPVGADDDVDAAVGQALDGLLRLGVVGEPGQPAHRDRERRHPLGERRKVLLGQQSRRHQDDHLLAVLHRLERGSHGDLGLAVADVAGDHPVHRRGLLHVRLDLVDGRHLVRRLGEREGVLEFTLPRGVRGEGVAGRGGPSGVQLHQLGGDVADRLAGPALGLGPVGTAELVHRGQLAADVAGQQVERVGRDEQPVARVAALARRVLHHQVFTLGAAGGAADQVDVLADAVLGVHHVVARLEHQRVDGVAPTRGHLGRRGGAGCPPRSGQVGFGDHGQARAGDDEAVLEPAAGDGDHARRRWVLHGVARNGHGEIGLGQPLGRASGGAGSGHHHHGDPTLSRAFPGIVDGHRDLAPVGRGGDDVGRVSPDP